MFNIFIIGSSNSAKTSIANKVGQTLSMPVISASDWVKKTFKPNFVVKSLEDKQRFIQDITDYSLTQLQQDPEVCLKYIRLHYPEIETKKGYVLEGFRNPKDFLTLFNPSTDYFIYIDYVNNQVKGSSFELDGLSCIRQSIDWLYTFGLIPPRRRIKVYIDLVDDDSINSIVNDIVIACTK